MFKAAFVLALSALFLSGPAAATPLYITNIVGGWSNIVGGQNVTTNNVAAQGTDMITWGNGVPPDSGYHFTPSVDIPNVALDTNILLGTFVHFNEPIPRGTYITSVDYDLSFSTNGLPPSLMTTLMFDHNETRNRANPCADGGALGVGVNSKGCADIVTVTAATLNSPIDVGGEIFFFNLLGFSLDGGMTFDSQFLSPERGSNTVGLYGIVSSVPVPEPGTLSLLGAGLAAAGIRRFRKRRAYQRRVRSEKRVGGNLDVPVDPV